MALFLALGSAGALISPPATSPASAQAAVSVSLFYRELAPHGRWFQHPRWGWAWFPTAVDADWRPYSRGNWVWTDENGWYWVSDEPFGWATYHYGRWAYDEQYGWIWIPGGTWGPAWVAFRYSDADIGWAPLPPETLDASYGWDPSYTELDASYYLPRWVFIPRRHFLDHRVYTYAARPERNAAFFRASRNVTHYERGRRGVFNRSIEPRRLEAALGRRIAPVRINVVNNPRRVGPDRRGVQVNVFRPDVRVARDAAPPAEMRARAQDRPRVRIQRDAVAPTERRDRASPPATLLGAKPPAEAPRTVTPGDRRDDRRGREDRRATPAPNQPPGAQPPLVRTPDTARPQPTPPGAQPPLVRTPDTARPQPTTPPGVAPPNVPRTAQPDERRGRDERGRVERRGPPTTPGAKPSEAPKPGFAQTPRTAPPGLRRGRDERAAPTPALPRTVTHRDAPRPPAATAPQRPPSFATPQTPQRPPSFAPPPAQRSAPPSFARPAPGPQPPRVAPSAPPQRAAPAAPPPRAAPPAAKPAAPPAKAAPAKPEEKKGPFR